MNLVKLFIIAVIFSIISLSAQTVLNYQEDFNSNSLMGWSFTESEADISIINNELNLSTNSDEFVYLFPPIGASKDDFSFKIISGSSNSGLEGGGFGRMGFKSLIAILISDPIYSDSLMVVYSNDIESYDEPNFTPLASYPIPDEVNSLQLVVTASGANLNINAYVNDVNFYSGQINNADPGLFTGNMLIFLDPTDDNSLKEWSLDKLEIQYNPLMETSGNFIDEFNDVNSPWFRTGDFDYIAQSVNISNGKMNFNYNSTDETALFVIPPTPPVLDFDITVEGGGSTLNNSSFGISRFYNYKNYVTFFIEDNQFHIGYADNNYEPTVLASAPFNPLDISKIRCTVEEIGNTLDLNLYLNDQFLLSGTVTNPSEKLRAGRLILGYDRGNLVDAYFEKVMIDYMEYRPSMLNTSLVYHETFSTNNKEGWAFTAYDADVSVLNGQLLLTSNADDLIHIVAPIDATEGDFSFEVKPGIYMSGQEGGGFGRASLNGFIAIQYSDYFHPGYIDVIYSNDIQDYAEPNFTVLGSFEAPDEIESLKLDVIENGNNLLVSAYLDNQLVYSGEIENVDEGLKTGKMYLVLDPLDDDALTEWSMDEVIIKYNPFIKSSNNYYEEFNNPKVPWFRFGDLDNIVQSVFIDDGKLKFNYNAPEEANFYIMTPVGAVKDFSIELEGWGSDQHNSPFSISRMFDYKNYVTFFIEDNELNIGYSVDSWEPIVLNSMPFTPTNISKIKFTIETVGNDLSASILVNDQYALASTITNPPDIIKSGHIAFGYDRGNVMDAYIDYANIDFNQFITDIKEDEPEIISDYYLSQNYPNPFNPTTNIRYSLNKSGYTTLKIYDILGREVSTLINQDMDSGTHEIQFDGSVLSTGVYLYKLSSGSVNIVKKMLLVK